MGEQIFEIWQEGYSTSEGTQKPFMLGVGVGSTFDEAVQDYINSNPSCGITSLGNERYKHIPRYYASLKSDWVVYGCCLYSSKEEAEKRGT